MGFLVIIVVVNILVLLLIWRTALRPSYLFLSRLFSEKFASNCIQFLVYFSLGILLTWTYILFGSEIYYFTFGEPPNWHSVDANFLESLGVITLGYLGTISIPWQLNVLISDVSSWDENGLPKRITNSSIVCSIIFFGVIITGLFKIHDIKNTYEFVDLISDLGKTIPFSILFLAKTYISVVISNVSIGLIVYQLSHDLPGFDLQESLNPIIGWALRFAPDFIRDIYAVCSSIYFLCISGIGGILARD